MKTARIIYVLVRDIMNAVESEEGLCWMPRAQELRTQIKDKECDCLLLI